MIQRIFVGIAAMFLVFFCLQVGQWQRKAHGYDHAHAELQTERDCKRGTVCFTKGQQGIAQATADASSLMNAQYAIDQEVQNALHRQLEESDRNFVAAAGRFSRLRVCPTVSGTAAAAAAPGDPGAAGQEPPRDPGNVEGLGSIGRNCESDAINLDAFNAWYARLREERNGRQ